MLNADELGEKGQARFKEICADAGLICNKSDRDRTGWDFIVEFQYDVEAATELETRKVPLSCHVQVKTLLDKNDRFQMRLSSAERLAKELKPAFVYVFKVNSSLEFTAAYLIHILDQPLGKILKRLRKEDVAGNSAANRKTLSMSASGEGLPISPTGLGLSKALSTAIGNDLNAYSVAKEGQLMSLGFEERPYSTEMNIQMSMPDLVDAFLGLKEISATGLRAEHSDLESRGSCQKLQPRMPMSVFNPRPQTCVRSQFVATPFPLRPYLNVRHSFRRFLNFRPSTARFSS